MNEKLEPVKTAEDSFWFMFESGYMARLSPWAQKGENQNPEYRERFKTIKKRFDPNGNKN